MNRDVMLRRAHDFYRAFLRDIENKIREEREYVPSHKVLGQGFNREELAAELAYRHELNKKNPCLHRVTNYDWDGALRYYLLKDGEG